MPNDRNYVFLHGLGLSHTIWSPLVPLVKGNMISPDLLGHGSSPIGGYSFESLWDFLRDELIPLDWDKTSLIMHSMSAALLPEVLNSKIRPRSICLIEGNLTGEDSHWSRQICQKSPAAYESWLARLRANSGMVLGMQLSTSHNKDDLVFWSSGFKQVDESALRQIAEQLVLRSKSGEILSAIKEIDSPTTYLRGAKSGSWTEGTLLLAKIGVPVIEIPNAGHYPMIDNPSATWESISSQ
jgi:pimeloyl-ACP methyl ester carboxylesterase